jgi:hypothetical protein
MEVKRLENVGIGLSHGGLTAQQREFGSLQLFDHAIWSAAAATRRPRRAEVQRSIGGREATAHPVVCGRRLASRCRLVSTSHVSPLCKSTHTTPPYSQQPFQ